VTDRATARAGRAALAELFKRQGYQENYVNGNFDDYVSHRHRQDAAGMHLREPDRQLRAGEEGASAPAWCCCTRSRPSSNKVVFVADQRARQGARRLLANDAELQGIACDYGFRIADSRRFAQAVQATGSRSRRADAGDRPAVVRTDGEMIDVVTQGDGAMR
jgi:phosphoketolase